MKRVEQKDIPKWIDKINFPKENRCMKCEKVTREITYDKTNNIWVCYPCSYKIDNDKV